MNKYDKRIRNMKYRTLGRTGIKVSELGLGGHEYTRFLNPYHFPGKRKPEELVEQKELVSTQSQRTKLIKNAIDGGINYFDTGVVEECQSLGLALKTLGRREDVNIAAETMGPVARLESVPRARWRDTILEGIEERLKVLGTSYIDVYNVHEVSSGYSRERFEFVIDIMKEIKGQEKIRAIGVADHQPGFVAELMRKFDCFDSVMIPYNYDRQEAKQTFFPLCKSLDVGVVVMKPFCWPFYGIPFTHFCPEDIRKGPFSPSQTALKWILKSPEVSTVVPGTNTEAELEENIAAITKDDGIDEEILRKSLEIAKSPQGTGKLKELVKKEEMARTRAYIRSYAKRALDGWIEF
jgi:aryl-alcohol dehydrogenase-like predicted oxidoreductase